MKRLALICSALAVGLLASAPAKAQSSSSDVLAGGCGSITYDSGRPMHDTQDINGKKCVNATVTASITGFTPAAVGTPIAVTTGGVTGTLPAGTVVVASNVGTTNTAYCALGAASTTAWQPITPNGGWFAFTVGAATQLSCITTASTTTVNLVGGAGLPTGTGGGGGGSGGGGGAVTLAAAAVSAGAYVSGSVLDGAIVTIGALADAAWTSGNGTVIAVLKAISGSNTTIATNTGTTVTNTGTTNTDLGPPGATACATDTGSCSLNALMQRVAQRLTTVVAGIPVTTVDGGQTTIGTTSDAAWISGAGTVISLLKALVAQPASSAIATWAGSTLGAISNYGTAPGAVLVPAMNSFQTGSANFAAASAAIPAALSAMGVSDGGTGCSGSPCLIAPTALVSGAPGAASAQVISTQPPWTPTTAIATGTTGAVTATLAIVANKTNFICGFDVSGIGGTAALSPITVTGLLGGTFTYQGVVSAVAGVNFTRNFGTSGMCIPASAQGVAIAVVTTADGTATAVDVQAWGYYQ